MSRTHWKYHDHKEYTNPYQVIEYYSGNVFNLYSFGKTIANYWFRAGAQKNLLIVWPEWNSNTITRKYFKKFINEYTDKTYTTIEQWKNLMEKGKPGPYGPEVYV